MVFWRRRLRKGRQLFEDKSALPDKILHATLMNPNVFSERLNLLMDKFCDHKWSCSEFQVDGRS